MKPLTPRQIEILKRIAVGETVKAVAIDLAVSPKTVEFHWAKVKEKLKISSHAEAAHYAIARLGVPLMFSLALAVTGCRSDRPVNINPATARASVPTNVVDSATFAWDASPSSGVTGYKFYQGAKSRGYTNSVKVGNVLTFTTTNLPAATNFFAVTAYDATGNNFRVGFTNFYQ